MQKPPQATPKPPPGLLIANGLRPASHPHATLMRPQSHPKATFKPRRGEGRRQNGAEGGHYGTALVPLHTRSRDLPVPPA